MTEDGVPNSGSRRSSYRIEYKRGAVTSHKPEVKEFFLSAKKSLLIEGLALKKFVLPQVYGAPRGAH